MASELLENDFIATVIKLDKEKRRVGVYIPRLMPAIYGATATGHKYPTNNGINITNINKNISATVTKVNYFWVNAKEYTTPLPEIGSTVIVTFLDGTPNIPYWEEFDYNGANQIIEEERYPDLFDLSVNNKNKKIKTSDTIKINTPDNYIITTQTENKNTTFNILENFDFYKQGKLQEVINNLQKSVSYIETKYFKTFIDGIQMINLFETTPEKSSNWFKVTNTNLTNDEAVALLNEIDLTKYSLLDRYIIEERINQVKMNIYAGNMNNYSLLKDFEKFLSVYNLSISEYTYAEFNKLKTFGIESIDESENLLDAGDNFSYYNKLLLGLKDVYGLYETYLQNFNNLDNSIKQKIRIDSDIINTNIRSAFSKAKNSTNISNVDKYVTYIKNLFPETAKITYKFSIDGENFISTIKDTKKIFSQPDDSDKIISVNGKEVDVTDPSIDFMPVVTSSKTPIIYSKFKPVTWVDDSQDDIFDTNYYLIKNINATPKYIGCYLVYDDLTDLVECSVLNDTNVEYSLLLNDEVKTLTEINSYIKTSPTGETKITIKYNSKEISLVINNNNEIAVETLIEIIDGLSEVAEDNCMLYEEEIIKAESLYLMLNDENKAKITNYDQLSTVLGYYNNSVVGEIRKIIALDADDIDVTALKSQYNELTISQLALLTDEEKTKIENIIL